MKDKTGKKIVSPLDSLRGPKRKPHRVQRVVRRQVLKQIASELDHAYGKHGRDQWGRHEFYAILKEEVDELWDAIKSDLPQNIIRSEAIQVAAMVFRYLETGDRYREPSNIRISDSE